MDGRLPRRAVFRALGLAAGTLAAGPVLPACGPTSGAAAPTTAAPTTHILIQLNWQGGGGSSFTNSAVQKLADQFITQNWLSRHPGVAFTTILGGGSHISPTLDNDPTIAAIIAGSGPDIVEVCCYGIPGLEDSGLLVPLDPFVQQDNIDLSIYPAGVMTGLRTDHGLMGLPNAGQTEPIFINLSLLDALGLAYPDPAWDYRAAEHLWREVARTQNGKAVYGADLNFAGTMMGWLVEGFGGHVYDPARTTCLLDSPASVAAFQWLVPLIAQKVVIPRQSLAPVNALAQGQVAFATACCGALASAVFTFGTQVKWDIVPMPSFPAKKANGIFHALYGMNATSHVPQDLLWDLLKFLCVDSAWQMFWNAQLALASPNQITPALWEQWIATIRAVAPITATKHLEYFADAAQYGQGWSFAKTDAQQAGDLETQYYNQMAAQKVSVEQGLGQLARQITALQKAAAAADVRRQAVAPRFPTAGPDIAQVPTGV